MWSWRHQQRHFWPIICYMRPLFQPLVIVFIFIGCGVSITYAQNETPPNVTDPSTHSSERGDIVPATSSETTLPGKQVVNPTLATSLPHVTTDATAASLWYHLPALNITGPAIPTRDPERFTIAINRLQTYVSIRLYSDIWFPWIVGLIDETHDLAKRFDNRALAQRHTPRLNRFLCAAREATLAAECPWSLNRDPDALRSDCHFMVNDEGIDLEDRLSDELTVNDGLAQPDKLIEAKAAL